MLKKTIKYTDYNGNERTEDFYFNLTKAELIELQMGTQGGLTEMVKRIVNVKDAPAMLELFKKIILKAYGTKSDDGRRFIKSAELSEEFEQTEAYSELIIELLTGEEAAIKFIKSIVPAELSEKLPENVIDVDISTY